MSNKKNFISFEVGDLAKEFTITEWRCNKSKDQFEFIYGSGAKIFVRIEKNENIDSIIEKIKTTLKKELVVVSEQKEDDEKLIDEFVVKEMLPQIQEKLEEIYKNESDKDNEEDDEIREYNVYKYSQDIPLIEE